MDENATLDRELIAFYLMRFIERDGGVEAVQRNGPPSRATVYRIVRDCDPKVSDKKLRQLNDTLGLPYNSVTMVGRHDWEALRDAEMDPSIIRWLKRHLDDRAGGERSVTA